MTWITIGALLLGIAVFIGAFGAHALKDKLDAYSVMIYERSVSYHFTHAIGLVAIGVAIRSGACASGAGSAAGAFILVGLLIFCGSLYALSLTGNRKLGAITPIGGVAFIIGWFVFAYGSIFAPAP
jgi:uncharacterized membrane protein YgdD (TMEM256/DUF423 family)